MEEHTWQTISLSLRIHRRAKARQQVTVAAASRNQAAQAANRLQLTRRQLLLHRLLLVVQ